MVDLTFFKKEIKRKSPVRPQERTAGMASILPAFAASTYYGH
jgi:hypothetical protein